MKITHHLKLFVTFFQKLLSRVLSSKINISIKLKLNTCYKLKIYFIVKIQYYKYNNISFKILMSINLNNNNNKIFCFDILK